MEPGRCCVHRAQAGRSCNAPLPMRVIRSGSTSASCIFVGDVATIILGAAADLDAEADALEADSAPAQPVLGDRLPPPDRSERAARPHH